MCKTPREGISWAGDSTGAIIASGLDLYTEREWQIMINEEIETAYQPQ